jgi:RNA polymerase sigma-70 factor (ECF subfamily)
VSDLDVHVPAIAAGDAAAFGQWLSAAERPIRASLRSFAAAVDTEAILQEALLRAWQVAPRFVPDGRPNGLLRLTVRMAKNLAISETRRARVDFIEHEALELEMGDDALSRMANPPDPLLRRVIEHCREKLPNNPKRALAERLSNAGRELDAEIAARLEMRTNTFLQNITRARKLLAECLKANGVDLESELA